MKRVFCILLAGALGSGTLDAQELSFVDVAVDSGLTYSQVGAPWSVAPVVGDFDGDGWMDVLLVGGTSGTRLFRNNGNKTFKEVTQTALPPDMPNATMGLFADVDNDGDPDLGLARWNESNQDTSFVCYLNESGVFRGAMLPSSAPDQMARFSAPTGTGGLAIGDLNGDSVLDVVFMHYYGPGYCLDQSPRTRSMRRYGLERILTDVSPRFGAGISTIRRHFAAVLGDFNNDGFLDLHVAIDGARDYQARNLGDGTFIDVSLSSGVTNVGSDMGLCVGDIENDGDLDIFSSNIEPHVLYVNDGTGYFTNQANSRGVARNGSQTGAIGWGAQFADLDIDCDIDLVEIDSGTGLIAVNHGDGYFTILAGTGAILKGFGLVALDYDRDGDQDLIATGRLGNVKLYENVTPAVAGRHWMILRLEGTHSNRDAIGARVYATVGDTVMMREVICGDSFISGAPMLVHFGLGDATTVDRLVVRWPSGRAQDFGEVEGDRYLAVIEGRAVPMEE